MVRRLGFRGDFCPEAPAWAPRRWRATERELPPDPSASSFVFADGTVSSAWYRRPRHRAGLCCNETGFSSDDVRRLFRMGTPAGPGEDPHQLGVEALTVAMHDAWGTHRLPEVPEVYVVGAGLGPEQQRLTLERELETRTFLRRAFTFPSQPGDARTEALLASALEAVPAFIRQLGVNTRRGVTRTDLHITWPEVLAMYGDSAGLYDRDMHYLLVANNLTEEHLSAAIPHEMIHAYAPVIHMGKIMNDGRFLEQSWRAGLQIATRIPDAKTTTRPLGYWLEEVMTELVNFRVSQQMIQEHPGQWSSAAQARVARGEVSAYRTGVTIWQELIAQIAARYGETTPASEQRLMRAHFAGDPVIYRDIVSVMGMDAAVRLLARDPGEGPRPAPSDGDRHIQAAFDEVFGPGRIPYRRRLLVAP